MRDYLTIIPPEILTQVLGMIGSLVGLLLLWFLTEAIKWVKTKVSRERSEQLAIAIDKLVMWGVTQFEDRIRAKGPEGWADRDIKNLVSHVALMELPNKFPEALKQEGLDFNNPRDKIKLHDAIERAIPEVFARAAASPATPPALIPTTPLVIVPDPTKA